MEGEKCRREKEIVHRVQVDIAQRRQDKDHKKEQQQRDRREAADIAGQRSRLKFLRHGHADFETRNQALISPTEFPSRWLITLLGRRERVEREVDLLEVGP